MLPKEHRAHVRDTHPASAASYRKLHHDDNGRLTTRVEPRGNASGADPSQYTWSTGYDAAGNVVSETDPSGVKTVSNTYDGDGQLTKLVEGTTTVDFTYDADGNRTTTNKNNSLWRPAGTWSALSRRSPPKPTAAAR
ncbi:RHS repeat domain-containing protein [Streptomyces puniciscabiei]